MRDSGFWRRKKPNAGVVLEGDAVLVFKNGGSSRSEIRELPEGLVAISPIEPNLRSVRELAEIVEDALGTAGIHREPLALALPDLAVTTAVFPGRGRATERELREELGALLPYPGDEARCDFWTGAHDEVLAASIRAAVVAQYEQIVEAVDCRLAWVDALSLVRIPSHQPRPGLEVDLQLYRGHYALSVFHDGELVDARTKLRSAGDVESVCREVQRVPALHTEDASVPIDSLCLSGSDAAAVASELEGLPGIQSIRVDNDGDRRHLEASIETLLERGNP